MTIKERINNDLKDAMRAQDKQQVGALRLVTAAIKQIEVDERITVEDERLLVVLDKMVKQRKESIHQFQAANRHDLVEKEEYELTMIRRYLPTPLTDDEIKTLINEAFQATHAEKLADMGKIMAHLKPLVQGRADMSVVSALIKARF